MKYKIWYCYERTIIKKAYWIIFFQQNDWLIYLVLLNLMCCCLFFENISFYVFLYFIFFSIILLRLSGNVIVIARRWKHDEAFRLTINLVLCFTLEIWEQRYVRFKIIKNFRQYFLYFLVSILSNFCLFTYCTSLQTQIYIADKLTWVKATFSQKRKGRRSSRKNLQKKWWKELLILSDKNDVVIRYT